MQAVTASTYSCTTADVAGCIGDHARLPEPAIVMPFVAVAIVFGVLSFGGLVVGFALAILSLVWRVAAGLLILGDTALSPSHVSGGLP